MQINKKQKHDLIFFLGQDDRLGVWRERGQGKKPQGGAVIENPPPLYLSDNEHPKKHALNFFPITFSMSFLLRFLMMLLIMPCHNFIQVFWVLSTV